MLNVGGLDVPECGRCGAGWDRGFRREANAGCRAVSDCNPPLDALGDVMKDLLDLPLRIR